MSADGTNRDFSTEQVHAGDTDERTHGTRITPIYASAGFVFRDFAEAKSRFSGEDPGYVYSRINNPTNAAVEHQLAVLEGGVSAALVGSGQAAVTVGLLGLLSAGDHVLSAPSIYEGTRALFRHNFARFGIEVEFVENPRDLDEWRARLRPNTRVLYGESIPNPKNDLIDIAAIAEIAHEHGVPFAIDNTLATPYLLRPIEHGADIVLHSTSKLLSGNGSTIGGAIIDAGRFDWGAHPEKFPHLSVPINGVSGPSYVEKFGRTAYSVYTRSAIASRLGPSFSPFNAFLLKQSIETLSLRVQRHADSALRVAQWLAEQPEVESVDYAGLPQSPSYDLAQRYLPRGAGSVFAFTLAGGEAAAERVIDSVELFSRMTHIGDTRSLILHPPTTTHGRLSQAERERAGIWPGLIRLSIGLEEPADLIADLSRAFDALRGGAPREQTAPREHLYIPAEGL